MRYIDDFPNHPFHVRILSNASSVILFHNHPSGNMKEPMQDLPRATGVTQKSLLEAAKTTSSGSALELTNAEKTLVQLYRKADAETKKAAVSLLKGEKAEGSDIVSSLLGSVIDKLTGKQ